MTGGIRVVNTIKSTLVHTQVMEFLQHLDCFFIDMEAVLKDS